VRREKKRRWHVDYFLTETAFVSQIWVYDRHPEWECEINHLLESESNSFVPLPGFGASDCTHGCRAHLLGHPKQLKAVSFPLQPDWIVHLKDVTVDVISGLWENPVLL
jgi:Uri superfamily endonuclease